MCQANDQSSNGPAPQDQFARVESPAIQDETQSFELKGSLGGKTMN
jgi:hypothetical protein